MEKLYATSNHTKKETHCTRLIVGGNLLPFDGSISVPGATVTTTKCLVNSIVSTPKAKGLILDIAHFYLNKKLPFPEWMSMPISVILKKSSTNTS